MIYHSLDIQLYSRLCEAKPFLVLFRFADLPDRYHPTLVYIRDDWQKVLRLASILSIFSTLSPVKVPLPEYGDSIITSGLFNPLVYIGKFLKMMLHYPEEQ